MDRTAIAQAVLTLSTLRSESDRLRKKRDLLVARDAEVKRELSVLYPTLRSLASAIEALEELIEEVTPDEPPASAVTETGSESGKKE